MKTYEEIDSEIGRLSAERDALRAARAEVGEVASPQEAVLSARIVSLLWVLAGYVNVEESYDGEAQC